MLFLETTVDVLIDQINAFVHVWFAILIGVNCQYVNSFVFMLGSNEGNVKSFFKLYFKTSVRMGGVGSETPKKASADISI